MKTPWIRRLIEKGESVRVKEIKNFIEAENAETQCIPTFITPKANGINGKSKDMSIMKTSGYTCEELFKEMADM